MTNPTPEQPTNPASRPDAVALTRTSGGALTARPTPGVRVTVGKKAVKVTIDRRTLITLPRSGTATEDGERACQVAAVTLASMAAQLRACTIVREMTIADCDADPRTASGWMRLRAAADAWPGPLSPAVTAALKRPPQLTVSAAASAAGCTRQEVETIRAWVDAHWAGPLHPSLRRLLRFPSAPPPLSWWAARLGVSVQSIYAWARGARPAPHDVRATICRLIAGGAKPCERISAIAGAP